MKVKCIGNRGHQLNSHTLLADHHSKLSRFPLKIDDVYLVYGVLLFDNTLNYLTINMYDDRPDWTPSELFETIDSRLPFDWHHKFYGYEEFYTAVWGYKELAADEKHIVNLFEREEKALRVFSRRKMEIDKFESQIFFV